MIFFFFFWFNGGQISKMILQVQYQADKVTPLYDSESLQCYPLIS